MKNKKLLMIPGPSPVARSIQNEMGRETVSFLAPEFVNDAKSIISAVERALIRRGGKVTLGTGVVTLTKILI